MHSPSLFLTINFNSVLTWTDHTWSHFFQKDVQCPTLKSMLNEIDSSYGRGGVNYILVSLKLKTNLGTEVYFIYLFFTFIMLNNTFCFWLRIIIFNDYWQEKINGKLGKDQQ